MKTLIISTLLTSFALIASSCSGTKVSTQDDFNTISKKTTQEEFSRKFSSFIKDSVNLPYKGKNFTIFKSSAVTYRSVESSSRSETVYSYGLNGMLESRQVTKNVRSEDDSETFYLTVFKDGKYLYSGFLYELLRSTNPEIQGVGIAFMENGEKKK